MEYEVVQEEPNTDAVIEHRDGSVEQPASTEGEEKQAKEGNAAEERVVL